jgi:hypothetical protein
MRSNSSIQLYCVTTPEQLKGIKQHEAERKRLVELVLSKYQLINGRLVKIKTDVSKSSHQQ